MPISDITYSKRNSRIVVIKADDSKNKFGYAFLAFCDNNELSRKKAKPIVKYGSDGVYNWYELKHDETTQRPYLGRRLPEVDEFDDDAQDAPESEGEHSSNEEAIREAEKDTDIIQNSPIYAPPKLENPLPNPFSRLTTTMSTATTVQTATTSTTTGTTQNIPAVWDYFVEEFEQQYIDTQAPERARVALEGLKMKPPLIDEYIAKFEDLCRKAGYTVGSSEVDRKSVV